MQCVKTHPNFKSVDPNVQNATTLYEKIGKALNSQYLFEKISSPRETWSGNVTDIAINIKDIDRLYYVCQNYDSTTSYDLIARMQYNYDGIEGPVYIELSATCDKDFINDNSSGIIYFSRNAKDFARVVNQRDHWNKQLMYDSLKNHDGIDVQSYVEEEEAKDKKGMNLENVCVQTTYNNINEMEKAYLSELTQILQEKISNFKLGQNFSHSPT